MYVCKKGRLHRFALALCSSLFCVFLIGCIPIPEPEELEDDEPEIEAFYFETIGRGSASPAPDTTEVIVRDAEAWATYQERFQPPLPFKSVDFSQEMVILIAMPTETGGHSIMVEAIEREENGTTVTIRYVLNEPGEFCVPFQNEDLPFQAVIMRPDDGPFVFEHRIEPMSCEL